MREADLAHSHDSRIKMLFHFKARKNIPNIIKFITITQEIWCHNTWDLILENARFQNS